MMPYFAAGTTVTKLSHQSVEHGVTHGGPSIAVSIPNPQPRLSSHTHCKESLVQL